MRHLFIIPTTSCQAACKYCFTPNTKSSVMSMEVLEKGLHLFRELSPQTEDIKKMNVTFHGGEPLLAGIDFYKKALPKIYDILGNNVNIGLQSNLWALDDEYCSLFSEYRIGIGTSLDGPIHINDFQRGGGYFDKTFSGISILHNKGISPGCIATFTKYSAEYYQEIFDFFLNNNLHFSIHAALKPFGCNDNSIYLNADEYAQLLIRLLGLYIKNLHKIKIDTLDTMIKNISNDESGLCTFSRCIGDYLTVAPKGELYSCNRFIGKREYSLGNVHNVKGMADLEKSQGWQKLMEWIEYIDNECGDCLHKNICHGGCPYAGLSEGDGKPSKDPLCKAYKKVYSYILDKATDEFFSDENIKAISDKGTKNGKSSLFRKGSFIRIMNYEPHPYDVGRNARIILASAYFGVSDNLDRLADYFVKNGLSKFRRGTLSALERLYNDITNPSEKLNNLYIHITNECNLSCSFCYARAGFNVEHKFLAADKIISIIKEGSTLGFLKIVITGGEPAVYNDFSSLIQGIKHLKTGKSIPPVVLRTNLIHEFDNKTIQLISETFDEIVVSLDGSREHHDRKRGKGTYDEVMKNLKRFNEKILSKKISLTAVFDFKNTPPEIIENEKQHLKKIKNELNIKKIRFLPLLPIGRAKNMNLSRDRVEHLSVSEWIRHGRYPHSTCGIGYVVMLSADGNVYPCHVFAGENYYLGNIYEKSLKEIINSEKFLSLRKINVDTTEKCRSCDMRYLCGGGCRVWENKDCSDLYERARSLVDDSLKILGLNREELHEFFIHF